LKLIGENQCNQNHFYFFLTLNFLTSISYAEEKTGTSSEVQSTSSEFFKDVQKNSPFAEASKKLTKYYQDLSQKDWADAYNSDPTMKEVEKYVHSREKQGSTITPKEIMRYEYLVSKKTSNNKLTNIEEAELKVLSRGGSPREAYLESKKATGAKLSNGEVAELKVYSRGGSPREAFLESKKASGEKLSDQEAIELEILSKGGTPTDVYRALHKEESNFCTPDTQQRTCQTPDGRVFKLDNSTIQSPRAISDKIVPKKDDVAPNVDATK
jgi:hypothetical protein